MYYYVHMKIVIALLSAGFLIGCSTTKSAPTQVVRTTAYSHLERDSLPYGRKNAVGTTLLYGQTRSAAADWSVYPVGTEFRIKGLPNLFRVDDYGSALVGTKTIDLFFPTKKLMRWWGSRNVEIEIVKEGSYVRSREILAPRVRFSHIKRMIASIDRL